MLLGCLASASAARSLERPAPSCLDSFLFLFGEVVSWRFAQALPYVAFSRSRTLLLFQRSAGFACCGSAAPSAFLLTQAVYWIRPAPEHSPVTALVLPYRLHCLLFSLF